MAGSSLLLKKNQILFASGDPSNGMYLIRKGELQVFIPLQGEEVNLAKVEAGGMIGEMSLFDNKPRSASVRALSDAEVTMITSDDFQKLMKQIPKWFVSLMAALSTRLRETNERLHGVESKLKGGVKPFENPFRVLNIVLLLFYKDGKQADNKSWSIERVEAEAATAKILDLKADVVAKILDATIEGKLFTGSKSNYGKQVLTIANRGNIDRFVAFLGKFMTNNPDRKPVPPGITELLDTVARLAKESAYETVNISFDDAVKEGTRAKLNTAEWKNALPMFKDLDDSFSIVKVTNNSIGFKLTIKTFPRVSEYFKILQALQSKGAA